MKADDYSKKQRLLDTEIRNELIAVNEEVHDGKADLEEMGFAFEDEATNYLTTIDTEKVYFNGSEDYPISEVGTLDLIYLLGNLE